MTRETDFEKRRGVSRIEVRPSFAQVHISRLAEPLMEHRLQVLRAIADADVSIDFLKLTPSGLSCLIPEPAIETLTRALTGCDVHFTVRPDRSIVLVHAVNMRDEEGMIARIVQQSIASGARIDHVSDMHDRILMVVEASDAEKLAQMLGSNLVDESVGGRA